MPEIKITIIGAGNVGFHLAQVLIQQNYKIQQVFSRNLAHAEEVALMAGAEAVSDLASINNSADLYILAVPDDKILTVAEQLNLTPDKIIVHTSGSVESSILKKVTQNYGVFYPLQTFSRNRQINFDEIPVCIFSPDAKVQEQLMQIGEAISKKVHIVTDEERKYLHLSAVFINNYTNYIIGAGKDIADKHNVDFELLKPLLKETIAKASSAEPFNIQTGPARRGDIATIQKHLDWLKNDPDYHSVYQTLSEIILRKYKK